MRTDVGKSVSYGSKFSVIYLVHNTYIDPRRGKRIMLLQFKDLYWKLHTFLLKRYLFNVIPQILAWNIVNDITIKASIATKIIDSDILNHFPKRNYYPLYVCDQYFITFGTRKITGFCNTYCVPSMDRYPLETT